ncbi:MAG: hypothetical protein ACOH5I_01820 [Oligoflexus sp.]
MRLRFAIMLFSFLLSCQDDIVSTPSANPPQRYVLGAAVSEPIDLIKAWMLEEARENFIQKRQLAWNVLHEIWKTQELGLGNTHYNLPIWLSWYDSQEISRIFRELYRLHGRDARQVRAPFTDAAINQVIQWNKRMAADLPEWGEERLQTWVDQWQTPEQWHNLAGLSRTLYSPLALEHIMQNYAMIDRCYQILKDSPSSDTIPIPPCEIDEFPYGSIILKTSWTRLDARLPFKHYPIMNDSFPEIMQSPDKSWSDLELAETNLHPPGFIMQTMSGQRFLMTGMHAMIKLSRHWFWLSIWWSKDAGENLDFAFDRPEQTSSWLTAYQMCSSIDFNDLAPIDRDKIPESIRIARQSSSPESWCSNPYLEKGTDNQKTNCIGCHQFAGLNFSSEDILAKPSVFPRHGKTEQMQGFVADYLWSFHQGPGAFARMIRDTLSHYDQSDRYQ